MMTSNGRALWLEFGALAPPLAKQVAPLGVQVPTRAIRHCQRDADAIARLAVRGLLTDGEATRARLKLAKRINALLSSPTPTEPPHD